MARNSFFAEKRLGNNNPNFFNNMTVEEIRKNVKRIIRDIKYDNILEQDYIYFRNDKVISACLLESRYQFIRASVCANALGFYINDCLQYGITPYKTTNINVERLNAVNEQKIQNNKAFMWHEINAIFEVAAQPNSDLSILKNIATLNMNLNEL